MIHVCQGDQPGKPVMICGLVSGSFPPGDKFWFASETGADFADCPRCNPAGPRQLGTPISQLSGRPGHPGYAEFVRIAKSWGYE